VDKGCDRRTFLKTGLAVSAGLGLTASGDIVAETAGASAQQSPMPLPKRPLGKTGRESQCRSLTVKYTHTFVW